MPPERITGRSLRAAARAGRTPILRDVVSASTRAMLDLAALRRARISPDIPPFVAEGGHGGRQSGSG